jgi:DNA-directed RNA polymerase subunit H (RpoH/RPB5)
LRENLNAPFLAHTVLKFLKKNRGKPYSLADIVHEFSENTKLNKFEEKALYRRLLYTIKQLPQINNRVVVVERITAWRTKFYEIKYV